MVCALYNFSTRIYNLKVRLNSQRTRMTKYQNYCRCTRSWCVWEKSPSRSCSSLVTCLVLLCLFIVNNNKIQYERHVSRHPSGTLASHLASDGTQHQLAELGIITVTCCCSLTQSGNHLASWQARQDMVMLALRLALISNCVNRINCVNFCPFFPF